MTKPIRTPLNQDQLADAARLKAAYVAAVADSKKKGESPTLNQFEVGAKCGWNSPQSTVSQYLNGKVALNLDALLKISEVLDVEPWVISPTLAGGLRRVVEAPASSSADSAAASTPLPTSGDPAGTIDDHYAQIPYISAKAAAGSGYENPYVEARSTLAFKREWLKQRGAGERNLVAISADGDSMWPTINSGDVLLVDKSKIDPDHQQIFVLRNSEGIIVKRLVKGPLGNWVIRSDNEDKDEFPDLALLRKDEDEHRIIGRVIWRGGDL